MTAEITSHGAQIVLASKLLGQAARALGFQQVAITPATEVEQHALYTAWLDADCAGEMSYLHRDAPTRRDPRLVLEGARSVICVALPYLHPDPLTAAPAGGSDAGDAPAVLRGQIARYARAADYHLLLKRRLGELAEALARDLGAQVAWRACVDTAPVLERALAARAGLGFQGKNTLLITPGVGSFTVLGELLVDIELSPGTPLEPRCGACTLCIDVCPTGALRGPYAIDARRCISYLTIENTGPIPAELRPLMQDWVFGCDLCQEVCPWNAAARPGDPGFRPDPKEGFTALDYARPELVKLLHLGAAQFRRYVKRTALRRLARAQLLRNVAVALGNVGTPAEVPALCAALTSSANPPLVRQHVAWALGRIGARHPGAREAARTALTAALPENPDPRTQVELGQALAGLDPIS